MGPSLGLFNSQRCLLHTGSFTEQGQVLVTLWARNQIFKSKYKE